MKCDVIDGSVVNDLRQLILIFTDYSFVLDKPAGYKVFVNLKQFTIKKINKSVLNTISFYLENDNHEKVDFNQETLTFTLQRIRIYYNMFTYNYMSPYIFLYEHLYEWSQLYECLYLCIHIFIVICVITEF